MPAYKPAMALTEKDLYAMPTGNHRVGGVVGLTLQVNKTGLGRSWTLRYTDASGKRREVGLGSLRDLSMAQASEMARRARRKMAMDSTDPIEAKRIKAARDAARLKAARADAQMGASA